MTDTGGHAALLRWADSGQRGDSGSRCDAPGADYLLRMWATWLNCQEQVVQDRPGHFAQVMRGECELLRAGVHGRFKREHFSGLKQVCCMFNGFENGIHETTSTFGSRCRLRQKQKSFSHRTRTTTLALLTSAKWDISAYLVGSCHILPFGNRESGTYDASQTPAD